MIFRNPGSFYRVIFGDILASRCFQPNGAAPKRQHQRSLILRQLFLVMRSLGRAFTIPINTNWMSILSPLAINPGTMRMANPGILPVLLVFLCLTVMMIAFLPTLAPLGITALLIWLGCPEWVPICLPLTLMMCAAILFLYRLALPWQGRLLQAREQKILMVVTAKTN